MPDTLALAEALAPPYTREGDDVVFRVDPHRLTFRFARLHDTASGISTELTIHSEVLGPLVWTVFNLASTSQRETIIKKLMKYGTPPPWDALLDRMCRQAAAAYRMGAPTVPLVPRTADGPRELIEKFLRDGESNALVGEAGKGKSTYALATSLAFVTGTALPGGFRPTRRGRVYYADYESTQAEHEARLEALVRGLGVEYVNGIFYRGMTRSLVEEAAFLRAERDRLGIDLFIIDSLGPAGTTDRAESWHAAAIATLNAGRSLSPATRLFVAHPPKGDATARSGSGHIFGSVFNFALLRCIWELTAADEEDPDTLDLGLFHRKNNAGRLHPPVGLRFAFAPGSLRILPHAIEAPDVVARASIPYRILHDLRDGARDIQSLATDLKTTPATIRTKLYGLKGKGKVLRLPDGTWGLTARVGVDS